MIEIDNVDATLFEINNLYKINTYRSQNLSLIGISKMPDFYIHLREYLIIECNKLYYKIRRWLLKNGQFFFNAKICKICINLKFFNIYLTFESISLIYWRKVYNLVIF